MARVYTNYPPPAIRIPNTPGGSSTPNAQLSMSPPQSPIREIYPNDSTSTSLTNGNNFLYKNVKKSDPEYNKAEPILSKLTIYSHSGHIIQQYDAHNKMVTLPKSVEVASIVVLGIDGSIIPFSYIPETSMGIALVDRSNGEKVDATVIKENITLRGKILSLDSNNVMLMNEGEISNIRKYDRVTVNVNDDYTRPRLIINNDERNGGKNFTVSYLLSSISWNCVGTALIDDNKNIMYLRLAGNINNNTESDINADTTLVSGEVYQSRNNQNGFAESAQYAPRAMMAKSSPMSSDKVATSMLEDYVKYQVGNRIIRNKDIAELGTWSFPVFKLYIHKTNDDDTVRFGYRFTAPGFIPSCSLNVYSVNNNNNAIDAYLGSNDIDQSQQNDDIDIILGESTLLQCKSEVVVSDVLVTDEAIAQQYNLSFNTSQQQQQQVMKKGYHDGNWHIVTEDIKVEIINHNDKAVLLVLKHYIGSKKLIELRCQDFKKKENGFIEWYFQIPPKSGSEPRKEHFTCQVVTASFY